MLHSANVPAPAELPTARFLFRHAIWFKIQGGNTIRHRTVVAQGRNEAPCGEPRLIRGRFLPMAEKPTTEGAHNRAWDVYLSSHHDPVFIGTVDAPTSEAAIKVALKKFKITSPQVRARLVANRHGW